MATNTTNPDAFLDSMAGIIPRHFGPLRNASKIVARASGASPLSARYWIEGKCFPQTLHFVRLMAAFPALKAEVDMLVEQERQRVCTRS